VKHVSTPQTRARLSPCVTTRRCGAAAMLRSSRADGLRPRIGSEPAAPAVLPRDAECLEVVLAMRVVAADAVELHGLITVHRQHERRAEANALLFNVAVDLIDRRACPFEITGVQSHPPAGCEAIANA